MQSEGATLAWLDLLDLFSFAKPQTLVDSIALVAFLSVLIICLSRGKVWDRPGPLHHLWFERPQLKHGVVWAAEKQTRNVAQRMEELNRELVVFWGSQSGTAEAFANRLARDAQLRFGLNALTADLSDYNPETIQQIPPTSIAIFILSTFGEGDPSDNTSAFWDWAQKTELSLSNLRYMAFGLGNSNYKFYNRVVDVVVAALNRLGASPLIPVGKADDCNGGTEEDFLDWREIVFASFRRDLGLEEKPVAYQPVLSVLEGSTTQSKAAQQDAHLDFQNSGKSSSCSEVALVPVKASRELFQSPSRNCIHMELNLQDHPKLRYKTGDHIAVWPMNPEPEVDILLKALGLLDRRRVAITVQSLDPSLKAKTPSVTTIEALFKHHLEICAPVSRAVLSQLVQFAPSQMAGQFVTLLGSDKATYSDYLTRNHITLGRLLQFAVESEPGLTWAKVPLSFIIEALPGLRPRYYSISSSSVISPRQPSITALVSKTALPKTSDAYIHGVTSNYFRAIHDASHANGSDPKALADYPRYDIASSGIHGNSHTGLVAQIRRSKFRLPANVAVPVIMVAAGTGIAPFRAFIAERARLASAGRSAGPMLLFFGCRRADEDLIYEDELKAAQRQLAASGGLELVIALSRVDGVYVQDRVRERAADVLRMLDEGANIYICGRAAMAREVSKVVAEMMQCSKGWEERAARDWTDGLRRRATWQEDVWG